MVWVLWSGSVFCVVLSVAVALLFALCCLCAFGLVALGELSGSCCSLLFTFSVFRFCVSSLLAFGFWLGLWLLSSFFWPVYIEVWCGAGLCFWVALCGTVFVCLLCEGLVVVFFDRVSLSYWGF